MEAYGIHIVEIDGVSVVTHDGSIINPFTERFTQRYLGNTVGCSSIREDILSTIHNHFTNQSKYHYVRKKVVPINHYSDTIYFETYFKLVAKCKNCKLVSH